MRHVLHQRRFLRTARSTIELAEGVMRQNRSEFLKDLKSYGDRNDLLGACRLHLLHGTPFVFQNREDAFFYFRRRIADKFGVGFHEVFVVGSAKLGFSPHKDKAFDLDSDIDVVIVSSKLFDEFMDQICAYQGQLRRSRRSVTVRELDGYHQFLEYSAIGWMRPDKLPLSFSIGSIKSNWFNFFQSISYGKSEVGNYKVAAGVFKSYAHLETYLLEGLRDAYQFIQMKEQA